MSKDLTIRLSETDVLTTWHTVQGRGVDLGLVFRWRIAMSC